MFRLWRRSVRQAFSPTFDRLVSVWRHSVLAGLPPASVMYSLSFRLVGERLNV